MRILISGCGIAGPALAYWLLQAGIQPVIVERSPALRTGGYIVDFWGGGYELAEGMGIASRLQQTGYRVREVRVVGSRGQKLSGFGADVFFDITRGKFVSIGRGDLAAALYSLIDGQLETIFGDSVRMLRQDSCSVQVQFESGRSDGFDLVIGADGLHSRVREVAFGPADGYEKYLGCKAAAFVLDGYAPRDELVYVMYTRVGRQVARFAMRGGRTMFLFTFADPDPSLGTVEDQKQLLRERFGNAGWECAAILAGLDSASDFYYDRVSQIRMGSPPNAWHRGRIALLGDAASCISLLGGQGSALGIIAAYLLAYELAHCKGNFEAAFQAYEQRFGPFVRRKQDAALRFAGTFVPNSRYAIFVRNVAMRLMNLPLVANFVVGRDLADRIHLPGF